MESRNIWYVSYEFGAYSAKSRIFCLLLWILWTSSSSSSAIDNGFCFSYRCVTPFVHCEFVFLLRLISVCFSFALLLFFPMLRNWGVPFICWSVTSLSNIGSFTLSLLSLPFYRLAYILLL